MQAHIGPVLALAASVSGSAYMPFLVDSKGLFKSYF